MLVKGLLCGGVTSRRLSRLADPGLLLYHGLIEEIEIIENLHALPRFLRSMPSPNQVFRAATGASSLNTFVCETTRDVVFG